MSLWSAIKGIFAQNSLKEMSFDEWAQMLRAGRATESGSIVNTKTAMEYQPAASAILTVSELLSTLPMYVCQRRPRQNIEEDVALKFEIVRLDDHPLMSLLGPFGVPNSLMDTQEFYELGTRQRLTYGDFLCVKNVVRSQLRELIYIKPKAWQVTQNSDLSLNYNVTFDNGANQNFTQDQVFHLRGPLDDDGCQGLNRIQMARENIGLGMAQDKHASKMFQKGTRLSGWVKHPGSLTDTALERLKQSFAEMYGGADNHYKTAVLEEGMDFVEGSMNAEESQLTEGRNMQRSVVSGNWGVPPHLIGDLSHATFSNIESQALQFVVFTLLRSTEGWEKAISRQLLSRRDRVNGIFVKFDEKQLLRGDMATRSKFYDTMRRNNAMSPNEMRVAEGWPVRTDPGGDSYDNPNTTPGEPDGSETEDTGDDAQAGVVPLQRVV